MPRTVLIVDDHAGFRRFARGFLEAGGFTVVGEASDGEGALVAADTCGPSSCSSMSFSWHRRVCGRQRLAGVVNRRSPCSLPAAPPRNSVGGSAGLPPVASFARTTSPERPSRRSPVSRHELPSRRSDPDPGAVPVIAAAALLAAFAHEFVSEDVAPSPGRVIEGSVWIVTGLIAWWRVPGNRIGPLATAFGFVDIAGLLYWDAALPFSLAPIVSAFIFAIGVHLFLAFPTGRLQTRTDRAVVAFAYGATVILAPAGAMFRDTGRDARTAPRTCSLSRTSPHWRTSSTRRPRSSSPWCWPRRSRS